MFFTTNDIHFANIFDAFYESIVLLFFFESLYILIFRFDNYFLYISFQFIENFNHHANHIFLLTTSLRFFLGNQKNIRNRLYDCDRLHLRHMYRLLVLIFF